jgi:hypothetical protein
LHPQDRFICPIIIARNRKEIADSSTCNFGFAGGLSVVAGVQRYDLC